MNKVSWLALMERLGFKQNSDTFEQLIDLYSESHRYYHNYLHISAVLEHLSSNRQLANNYNAVEVALWFHDAIYQIYSSKNESKSAELAVKFLQKNDADDNFCQNVYDLILATKHSSMISDSDEQLIVDIDLTILGSAPAHYQNFERSIRREYKWVPSPIYRKKRKQLLNSFVIRDRIYHHEVFFNNFERQARENILAAIKEL